MDVLEVSAIPKPAGVLPGGSILLKAFSFPALLGLLLVAGVSARVYLSLQEAPTLHSGHSDLSIIEGDTWFHILVGEDILKTHHWPTTDTYSYTAYGNESMAFEWVGQVGMALIYSQGGLRGLTAAVIALAAILLLLLYYYAWLRSGNSKAAFVSCALVLPLASAFFSLRPQLLGYIFLVLTLICLEHFRSGRRKLLWVLPALFALWVNLHGSFMLGLAAFGVCWLSGLVEFELGGLKAVRWSEGDRRQLALVFLLSLLGLTLTPYGTRVAGYIVHVILNASLGMKYLMEYQPLGDFGPLLRYFLILMLAFLLALIVVRPAFSLTEIVLLLGATYGAFVHARLLLFFVLIFTPLLARVLSRWVPGYEVAKDRPFLNTVLMALLAVGLLRFFPTRQDMDRAVASAFPSGAVDYLRAHPTNERVFSNDLWGSYIIRSLGQEHRIFIDGRSQLFEDAGVFSDYLHIIGVDREVLTSLSKYRVGACLIERQTPLATFLSALPDWQQVYADDLSALFVRKGTS